MDVALTYQMRDLLEKKLFPFVVKPGRYSGGEPGQIVKDPANRVSYLHAYPDKYEIGMSYVGLQSLYHIINEDDRFLCERAFAVDRDAEEIMRREHIPLFSLESSRPAASFDAIGFTLVDETVYTNMLTMIDLSGIPLRSADRSDEHPLVLAGGPAVYNPEPVADFVDAFFIGDAEEGIKEMLAFLGEHCRVPRKGLLSSLCQRVESVYVPSFYDGQGNPTVELAPQAIRARVITELKPEYYPTQPILPLIETVHNHLSVEIMRGCPQGCRFCLAGSIYRPVRHRSKDDIMAQVDRQLRSTGYSEVSLLSLSASDYPGIDALAASIAGRLEPLRVSLTLPSLRPGSISEALLDSISRVRKGGLTIAPEAGTERLRLFIRKNFPDVAIYDTVQLALDKGWTTLKLYFMIGLPTETEDDLLGIVDICRTIHLMCHKAKVNATVNVTLSSFTPKPHTPFQWDEIVPEETIYKKVEFVKQRCRLRNLHFKYHSTRLCMLVGILGRGDRRLADVIETAYRSGCRFDGWGEEFDYDRWLVAFDKCRIDVRSRLQPIPFTENLPWSHIRKGVSVDHLREERLRTFSELKEYVPHLNRANDRQDTLSNQFNFGRRKKKVSSRNLVAPTKNRVRICWERSTDYRYMSHRDNIRMLERAIRRAHLPVAYSQGYNPTMKLSFGPPLPLGFTSSAEYVDIALQANLIPEMIEALQQTLPEGIRILEARAVLGKKASLSSTLNRAVYTLPLDYWEDTNELKKGIDDITGSAAVQVERTHNERTKSVDIRPSIYDFTLDRDRLIMVLGIGDGGFARPMEVLQLLKASLTVDVAAVPIHRHEMYRVEPGGRKINPMEL